MNNNTQIETVEDVAKRITDNNGYFGEFATPYENGVIAGINFKKQQDEAEIQRLNASYEDSLSMQRCSNAGYESKINEWEAEYKQLLDSHNELLELLRNVRPLMQPREYCKGDDYLILDGRIENAINKAKNIKL